MKHIAISFLISFSALCAEATDCGSCITPVTLEAETGPGDGSVCVAASYDAADSSYFVKNVNLSDTARDALVEKTGLKRTQSIVGIEMICMTPEDDSALCDSPVIVTKEERFSVKTRQIAVTLQPKY